MGLQGLGDRGRSHLARQLGTFLALLPHEMDGGDNPQLLFHQRLPGGVSSKATKLDNDMDTTSFSGRKSLADCNICRSVGRYPRRFTGGHFQEACLLTPSQSQIMAGSHCRRFHQRDLKAAATRLGDSLRRRKAPISHNTTISRLANAPVLGEGDTGSGRRPVTRDLNGVASNRAAPGVQYAIGSGFSDISAVSGAPRYQIQAAGETTRAKTGPTKPRA